MRHETPLNELVAAILQSMRSTQFSSGTISNYARIFSRLQKLADNRTEAFYKPELGQAFIEDSQYAHSEDYCHTRYCLHYRCIQFIESYIKNGCVDWSHQRRLPEYNFKSSEFSAAKASFESLMSSNDLKANTMDGYRRLVQYFLGYLEEKGCNTFTQIKNGDIIAFIALVCKEHYQPTSLGAHLPGLRMFLNMFDSTSRFNIELPEHLPKKVEILGVYTDEEHDRIIHYLEKSNISSLDTDSEYIFLQKAAPFASLVSHSGCRKILFHAVTNAGIQADGRIYGTRITRHSTASRMLRKGVPLSVISEALGHGNPNSVMIYLSTENAKLVECTLPLPKKEDTYAKE